MTRYVLAAFSAAALAAPGVAQAHRTRHHASRHHARAAVQHHEYWPILEEWLTPQEGREVEASVTAELNEVAEPES